MPNDGSSSRGRPSKVTPTQHNPDVGIKSEAEEQPSRKANLRKGWTTGACAAAATRAAYEALIRGQFPESVSDAGGLSASTIARLSLLWHEAWTMTFLSRPRKSRSANSFSFGASHGVYLRSGA